MGSEYRYAPHRAIQSLLTYCGSIRNLNLSSTPIGRCFTRQKSVVDVVGACMDTIFSRQNYRSSLLRKSFFRGVFQGTSTCSVLLIFPFFTLHTIQLARKYVSELHRGEGVFYVLWHTPFPTREPLLRRDAVTPANSVLCTRIHPSTL